MGIVLKWQRNSIKAEDYKDLSEIWRKEIKKKLENEGKRKENGDMDNERE